MFAYTAHVACDNHNFVLGCDVSAGNVHDSVMFDGLYKDVLARFSEIEAVGLDCGYKTPWIMKQIFNNKHKTTTPYKRPMTKEGFFKKYEYVYDPFPCFGKILTFCAAHNFCPYLKIPNTGFVVSLNGRPCWAAGLGHWISRYLGN